MRASLRTGASFGALTLAIEALAVLPGRIALGRDQSQFGRSPAEYVTAGTLRDVSDLALPIGMFVAFGLLAALVLRRSRERWSLRELTARTTTSRVLVTILASVTVVLWLTSSMAAEFKIQRGVDATLLDMDTARNATSMGRTFLGFMSLRRHSVPGVLMLAVAAALLVLSHQRARGWPIAQRLAVITGFVMMTVLGYGLALVPLDPHVRIFRTITDRNVVGAPFVNLFESFGRSKKNVRLGMKALVEHAEFPPSQSRGGEALLGLPVSIATDASCGVHPMARSIPVRGVESARPDTTGYADLEPDAATALELLDRLSSELYAERSTPIDVWQVMIESFRADDLHALSPAAPRSLAPFMNSLYESAEKGEGSVIAIRRMWQAGARTSQGLSSYMCGLGMMPYGLSYTRDFGPIPVRCLPEVLVDARFDTSFFYGGNPSFDEMDTFFRQQGMRDIVGQLQQPLSSPTSEGGVSDRALFAHATEAVAKRSNDRDRARFTLVMTSSNHVPYRRPDDLPDEIDARVSGYQQMPGYTGNADDATRLRTFAYADLALSELFDHVGRGLERSVFILGADHATADPLVWPTADRNIQAAHALIPYTIVFPEPLIAKSARPQVVRDLVRKLNEALDHHAWSQNDTPLFLLTLLAHSPQLQAMPPEARWHTLGGERTSPFFRPPQSEVVKVIGIDCAATFFGVDDEDKARLPSETASFVKNASEIYTVSPSLIPVSAYIASFLKGYASQCRSPSR